MFSARPAAEIEPVSLISSSRRTLPGPSACSGPKSMRRCREAFSRCFAVVLTETPLGIRWFPGGRDYEAAARAKPACVDLIGQASDGHLKPGTLSRVNAAAIVRPNLPALYRCANCRLGSVRHGDQT